jgi:hypothetical protein
MVHETTLTLLECGTFRDHKTMYDGMMDLFSTIIDCLKKKGQDRQLCRRGAVDHQIIPNLNVHGHLV